MAVSVQVIGRLGANSEIRTSKNGNQFVSFRMATDEFKNGNKETAWLNVSSYDDRALKLSQFLTKGRLIAVYGIETVSIYTDRNGAPQISRDIRAERIEFINSGQQNQEQSDSISHHQGINESKDENFPPIDCGTLSPKTNTQQIQLDNSQTRQQAAKQPQMQPQFTSSVQSNEDDDLPF